MQLSVSTFLETVEKSGLVEKSQLARSVADLEREQGAEAANDSLIVSAHLNRVGLITEWQSKRLLEGRHAGFFLGKYRLIDHLGTGGMSSVYLAEHPLMRRRVAIKVLPKNRVNDSSYLARFHREARAVAALDHPNIVRAFDVDNDGEYHYLVMEYIEGQDLHTLVTRDGPLAYRTAADYIRQAADGLAHAHEAGLVHRDVKPANLLIDAKHVVKLLDMGLARTSDEVDASLTKDHDERMLGTVDYLAPEQAIDSHLVDPRADIYSLGCTFYFALTGKPPFPDGTLAQRVLMHQTKEPADITTMRYDAPASLVAILQRMMAKKQVARYQTAADVSKTLSDWIARFDAGDRKAAAPTKTSDEDLKLAPLDDEPRRGNAAAPTRAASSAAEQSATVKSDTTKVERLGSAKTAPPRSGKLPVAKPISSSIKGATAKPPSSKSGPGAAALPKKPGSSVKGPKAPPSAGQAASARKPGSSIKGKPTQPPSAIAKARPPEATASSPRDLASDLPPLDPLLAPLPGTGLLDELLSGDAIESPLAGQPNLLSTTPLATPTVKAGRKTRWDSTWFLIVVGVVLGLALVGLFVAWRLLM